MNIKFLIYILINIIILGGCNHSPKFEVKGTFQNAPDSTVIYLGMDSTYIINDKFSFQGTVPHVELMTLKVATVNEYGYPDFKGTRIWIENHPIQIACPWDSLTSIYQYNKNINISGSPLNNQFQDYLAQLASIPSFDKLWEEYIQVYLMPAMKWKGVDIERGKELIQQINAIKNQKFQAAVDFVRINHTSPIALEILTDVMEGQSFTITEAKELIQSLDSSLMILPAYQQLIKQFNLFTTTAKGAKYTDLTLTNLDGKSVQLSTLIPQNQYILLEFWASWCKPCRAEIPHLRHVAKDYKDRLAIISISLDEKENEWKKAIKNENMNWTQLNDTASWNGQAASLYRITGVPFSLLLDPNGNIVAGELRGAELDVVLDQIFSTSK